MVYVLDTNVLVHTLRNSTTFQVIEQNYDPYSVHNAALISTVSIGELYSLAKRNRWGINLLQKLQHLLTHVQPIAVEGIDLMDAYSDIDAFSQGKHPSLRLGRSALNMGKNDLWIAATATVFQATLLTTDQDFNHLNDQFFKIEYISPK
jgi:predicted nucleic acid-binding protein